MMMRAKTVQCDAIAWTLFGISMATCNFLLSLAAGGATLVYVLRIRHAR
jgi:disulfide bond formation protein DsbB